MISDADADAALRLADTALGEGPLTAQSPAALARAVVELATDVRFLHADRAERVRLAQEAAAREAMLRGECLRLAADIVRWTCGLDAELPPWAKRTAMAGWTAHVEAIRAFGLRAKAVCDRGRAPKASTDDAARGVR